MLVLGTGMVDPSCFPFHGFSELIEAPYNGSPFTLYLGSRLYGLPKVMRLDRARTLLDLSENVRKQACVTTRTTMVPEYKPVSLLTLSSYGVS